MRLQLAKKSKGIAWVLVTVGVTGGGGACAVAAVVVACNEGYGA